MSTEQQERPFVVGPPRFYPFYQRYRYGVDWESPDLPDVRRLCYVILREAERQRLWERITGRWPTRADGTEWCPECGDQCYLICDWWTVAGENRYFYECKTFNRVGGPCEYQSPRFLQWPPEIWPPF